MGCGAGKVPQGTTAVPQADLSSAVPREEIGVRDAGILRIIGIPDDATFGGHGSATGSAGNAGLSELNGDWQAVPRLEVNGHPVWQRQTALRNLNDRRQPVDGDTGMRYVKLGGDGVLDIFWLAPGAAVEEASFRGQKERHGYICRINGQSFIDKLDSGWSGAKVCLALTSSPSFPDVIPYSDRLGRNVEAASAKLIKGPRSKVESNFQEEEYYERA